MRSKSGMTHETLVEMCQYNFLTLILAQMWVVECKTWKQLHEQRQTNEELVALVKSEEKGKQPTDDRPPPKHNQESLGVGSSSQIPLGLEV